jgi:tetratricopeptide (TPR) repeat protein
LIPLAALLVAFAVHAPLADTIVLNSGRQLEGAVVSETASEITIRTGIGNLRVRRAEIRDWKRSDTGAKEVDGDAAYAGRRFEAALSLYQEARQAAVTQPAALQRLDTKISGTRQRIAEANALAIRQRLDAAVQMSERGQHDAAIAELTKLRALAPTDEDTSRVALSLARAHFGKAEALRDRQDRVGRQRELEQAIAADPGLYLARLALGEMLVSDPNTKKKGVEEVALGLRQGEEKVPDEERTRYHYMIARAYFEAGDYQSAAANFAACLRAKKLPSAYSDALDRAVESYVKMGESNMLQDSQKTIATLDEALKLNPEDKRVHFLLGRIRMDTGETSKAIAAFEKVVAIDPKYQGVHHVLARAHLDRNNYDAALANLNKELENNPRDYDALADRADVHILLGSFDLAAKDVAEAIKIEPERWRAYLLEARLATAREEYDRARENLAKVLQIKPDSVEAYVQMGKVLAAEKKFDEAKKWFEQVVAYLGAERNLSFKYKSLMAQSQTSLGDIELEQDSPRSADTRMRTALTFVPDFAPAFNKMGDVRRRLANEAFDPNAKAAIYREAEASYLKAIELNPKDPDFRLSLGILYHRYMKDTERAIVNYQRYLDMGGRDKLNVQNWIRECGLPAGAADGATTAAAAVTTGTAATTATADIATTTPQ